MQKMQVCKSLQIKWIDRFSIFGQELFMLVIFNPKFYGLIFFIHKMSNSNTTKCIQYVPNPTIKP